jgi:hypothetical protein
MPEQNCCDRSRRTLAALALLVLGACGEPAPPAGYLELLAAPARGATCGPGLQGELQLAGVGTPEATAISAAELCAGAPLRRELAPGLYTLSWRRMPRTEPEPSSGSPLDGPAVLSLFAGQVTRLRVSIEPPVQAPRAADSAEETAPTCAYGAASSGAS